MNAGKARLTEHNTAVVSNAINVVTLSLGQILGKSIDRKLNGQDLTDEALTTLVAARLKNRLSL